MPWLALLRFLLPALAVLAAVGGLIALGYSSGSASVQRQWDAERSAQTEVNLEAERQARQAERMKFTAAKEKQDALTRNLADARGAAASAAAGRDSLLDTVATLRATPLDPDAARRAAGSAAAWDVLGECAKAVQAMAATADGLEARLVGWQEWWTAVKP